MKKDITFRPVEGVSIAVVPDAIVPAAGEQQGWQVYLLNTNEEVLQNVIVSSNGYGTSPEGEAIRTSTLRHVLPEVPPQAVAAIEPIDPAVFHLHNQYWVSYYIGSQVFDKKFVFEPGSIAADKLTPIALLDEQPGVLHR